MSTLPIQRAIVTGATGFLGGAAARRLAADGVEVVAPCRPESQASHVENVRFVPEQSLVEGLHGVDQADAVLHFATDYGRDAPASRVAQTNVVGSLELLEWALEHGARAFVNIDTCFTPDYPYLRPYTLSKKQFVAWGETLCEDVHGKTRFVNLVLQHPFGPGDRPGKFAPWIVERCLEGTGPIDLTAGDQEKDFIYVDDVAQACRTVLDRLNDLPAAASRFEVGRGEALSVRRFVEIVHAASYSSATLNFGALPKRPGEVERSIANIGPLVELGWRPQTSIEEGVRRTVEAARAARSQ